MAKPKTSMITMLLLSFWVCPAMAQEQKDERKSFEGVFGAKLEKVKRAYRRNEINDRTAWQKLAKLYDEAKASGQKESSELLQTQAYILQKGGFPLLSARYASWAIANHDDPFAKELIPSWELLDKISGQQQIHDILIGLAEKLIETDKQPPSFGKSWFYFLGEAKLQKGEVDAAITFFERVEVRDRYYYASRYQLAMTYLLQKENSNKAGLILKAMLSPEIKNVVAVKDATRLQYVDQAYLALARVQYEREKFVSSAKYYRKVRRTSTYYYTALFEQAWAFFLAGYPNHALGSLHGVDSPYFPGRFNPETSILRSIIYYWMCRYDDSKTALAEFIETYSEPVNNLETWLSQRNLSPEKAFQLFENMTTGVSSESLGIDRKLLESAAKTPPMVFARERLATVLAESEKLEAKGLFKSQKETKVPAKVLADWLGELSTELGSVYISELESLRDEYRNLRSQANFIYIELLMSEKEQILGKELHKEEKLSKVSLSKSAKGWGQGNMPWRASDKGEYWWDEVGFFVYQIQPKCNAH